MPQVPYNPVPNAPQGPPTPNVSISTPGAAFGENVASAIKGFGGQIEKSADELFTRASAMQELLNRADADKAVADTITKAGELQVGFSTLEGKDPKQQLLSHYGQLDELRSKGGEGLNPAARRLYDSETRSTIGRIKITSASYAAGQTKKYFDDSGNAILSANTNAVQQNPGDKQTFDDGMRKGREIIHQQGAIKGWDQNQIDQRLEIYKSGQIVAAIQGMVKRDPLAAKSMLDRYQSSLRADNGDLKKAQDSVQTGLWTNQSKIVADEVLAPVRANPDDVKLTEQDALDEADRKAKAISPDDVVFQDFVRKRVLTGYNELKTIKKNTDFEHMQTVQEAVNGGYGNKVPTTPDELFTTKPGMQELFSSLPVPMQRRINGWLSQNAKEDYPKSNENFEEFQRLKGMAQGDDAAKAEFLNTAVMDKRIPREWKGAILDLQRKIKANSGNDPRVGEAIRTLRSSGLPGFERSTDKDKYDRFTGALQDALDIFAKDHNGRRPNIKETNEIGSVITQQLSRPFFGWGRGSPDYDPAYNKTIPSETLDKIKEEEAKQGRPVPSDSQIQRDIFRQQLIDYYSKRKAEKK